jgi:HEAT repeat protein
MFTPTNPRLPTHILLNLHSPESTARAGALKSLASPEDSVKEEAKSVEMELRVQACADALEDPIPAVRLEAAKALGELRSRTGLDHLISRLDYEPKPREPRQDVRQQLVTSVGGIGEAGHISKAAIKVLRTVLQSDAEWEVRWRAARALGRFRHDQESDPDDSLKRLALSILERFHDDPDLTVELWSAWALARLGREEGFDRLVEALAKGGSAARRRQAATNLGELGDQRATPVLCEAADSDPDQKVRWLACEALKKAGDRRAKPTLVAALESLVPEIARRAAQALYFIASRLISQGDWSAVEDIRESTSEILRRRFEQESDTAFRAHCARALGWLRVQLPLFREILDERADLPWYVRAEVVWALGVTEGRRSVDLVSRLSLDDEHFLVRREAVRALGIIGDAKSLDILKRVAVRDPEREVRKAAGEAIRVIESQRSARPEKRMLQLSLPKTYPA